MGLFGRPPKMTQAEAFGHYTELLFVVLLRVFHVTPSGARPGAREWAVAYTEALRQFGGSQPGTRGQRALRAREILDGLGLADALDEAAVDHYMAGGSSRDFKPDFAEFAAAHGVTEVSQRHL